jgi:Circadian oscillating protein COP23
MDDEQAKTLDKQETLSFDPLKEREIIVKEREIALKELETKVQLEINHRNIWFTSPLLIGLASALFGLLGTALGAVLQGQSNFQLEKHKLEASSQLERQKFEFSLILKALESKDKLILMGSDRKEAAKKLAFLVNLGVIKTVNLNAIKKLVDNPDDLPTFDGDTNLVKSTFSCQLVNRIPTTVVQHPTRGFVSIIRWTRSNYAGGLSSVDQCKKVSSRFKEAQEKGILNFLTTVKRGDAGIICASKSKNGCEFELFEVPSKVNPESILEDIMRLNRSASASALTQ